MQTSSKPRQRIRLQLYRELQLWSSSPDSFLSRAPAHSGLGDGGKRDATFFSLWHFGAMAACMVPTDIRTTKRLVQALRLIGMAYL